MNEPMYYSGTLTIRYVTKEPLARDEIVNNILEQLDDGTGVYIGSHEERPITRSEADAVAEVLGEAGFFKENP